MKSEEGRRGQEEAGWREVCDDTTLTREVMWSSSRSDLRTENYVTYKPSDSILPRGELRQLQSRTSTTVTSSRTNGP